MKDSFNITHASVTGRIHQEKGINNQDASQWIQTDDYTIAIVTDGCSGSTDNGFRDPNVQHSEVGAHIGALMTLRTIEKNLSQYEKIFSDSSYLSQQSFWHNVRSDLLAQLRVLGHSLHDNLYWVLKNYFQFTIVGSIITEHKTCIFSLGDGWYELNGATHTIQPDEGYKQPYLVYSMLAHDQSQIKHESLFFTVHECLPTQDVKHLGIGSDGVHDLELAADKCIPGKRQLIGPVSQFWSDPLYTINKAALQNKINAIHKSKQLIQWKEGSVNVYPSVLVDDTTLIILTHKNHTI